MRSRPLRIIATFLLVCIAAASVAAAVSFVQSNSDWTSGAPSKSITITATSAGQSIVGCVVGFNTSATLSMDDPQGDVFATVETATNAGNVKAQLFLAANVVGGTTTVTGRSSISTQFAVSAAVYNGVKPNGALDQHTPAFGTGTTWSAGPVTTTAANELIAACGGAFNPGIPVAGAGFTLREHANNQMGYEDRTVPTAGSVSAAITAPSSQPWAMVMATFLPAPVAPTSFTQYGGFNGLPCTNVTGHFQTYKDGNKKQWLCDPDGGSFFSVGVFNIVPESSAVSKYGNADLTWGPQTLNRLKALGFNSVLDHSLTWTFPWTTCGGCPGWANGQPTKVPTVAFNDGASYPIRNVNSYSTTNGKDIFIGVNFAFAPGMYTGYHNTDPYDPAFAMWIQGFFAIDPLALAGGANPFTMGFSLAESDYSGGFGAAGEDVFATVPAGKNNPNLAWIVLVTNPNQTSNPIWGVNYTVAPNTTQVFAKTAFSNFMSARYSASIAALNAAWGSTYSTFGTQGGGWGSGTGLMDEDGRHAWLGNFNTLVGETSAMKADMNAFLFAYASQWFKTQHDATKAAFPNSLYLGPNVVGSWCTPPRKEVLQAAALYIDVLMGQTSCGSPSDQTRLDFVMQWFGDKPIGDWVGFPANADSAMGAFPNPDSSFGSYPTQTARGAKYITMMNYYLGASVSSAVPTLQGTKPYIAFRWWDYEGSQAENTNWGLVTPTGNQYNAIEAAAGAVPCVPPLQGITCGSEPAPGGTAARPFGNFMTSVVSANALWYGSLPVNFTLAVTSTNPGSGVTISPISPVCGGLSAIPTPANCSYPSGQVVTLTAPVSAGGNNFSGWTGCDSTSGTGNRTCNVTLTASRTISANFAAPVTNTLTIASVNPVSGVAMTVSPADVNGATNGSTTVTRIYPQFTAVTIIAPATSGANTFASWAGCDSVGGTGNRTCTKTMNTNATVTASYASPATFTLQVNSTLPATGVAITVSPADVNSQSNGSTPFSRTYVGSTTVTLTAPLTAGGNNFSSWTGCSSVGGPSNTVCMKTVTANATVTANYAVPPTETLTIASANPASGVAMVVSPLDINGDSNGNTPLTRIYPQGTVVTITAPASSGLNTFALWSGCDSVGGTGNRTCTKTMSTNATVTASYTSPATFTVNVLSTNPASGVPIAVSPADINGASNGTTAFGRTYVSTSVTLTAPLTSGINTFSTWTGCDSVSGPGNSVCTKLVNSNTSVTANYASPPTEILTVSSVNPGSGVAMVISPADVNGASNGSTQLTRTYVQNTVVTVTAPNTSGVNTFSSWTGCDSAIGLVCTKTMSANAGVTATYASPPNFTLNVTSTLPATPVPITVSPLDVNGQSSGSAPFSRTYPTSTSVTLTAALTAAGNNFSGWTGCNSVSGPSNSICTKAVTSNSTVTAAYAPPPTETLTIASVNPASGVAMVISPADVNGATNGSTPVARVYPQGTVVTITAPASSGLNTFGLWTGCDSVSGRACTKTMSANATVTASYNSPATSVLNVLSTNPTSAVVITVSPADVNGATNGSTPFARTYIVPTTVTLIAPATVGGNTFSSWTGCDVVVVRTCTKNLNANSSVTANYASPVTQTLTIASLNPATGVAMTVSPADVNGATNGSTQFTRVYLQGTTVTITAPATSGANTFASWTGCDTAVTVTCTKTMNANATITANYTSPAVFALTVSSQQPISGIGISVSPADVNALGNGTTPFVRNYTGGTTVTLVAPSSAGGNAFLAWVGCDVAVGFTCTKLMNANGHVTAVYAVLGATSLWRGKIVIVRGVIIRNQ
jgi:hypothetical protein